MQVTWEIHKAQLSAREMAYRTHSALWDWVFEHEAPEDEDEMQAPRLAALRSEWQARRASGKARRAADGKNAPPCRTRLVAADDETYRMVPDVAQRQPKVPAWQSTDSLRAR